MRFTKTTSLLLGGIPILALLAYGYAYPSSFFSNQEYLANYIKGFGVLAPLLFIGIQIIQVVLTPISHYAVGLVGGFIFGTWYGFLYNYVGRVLGHAIAFFLSRTIGRPIIVRFVKSETLIKYDKFWERGGSFLLFLIYYLPLFPDDEISYIAGTSKMKVAPFMGANLLGQIGGALALAYLGAGVELGTTTSVVVFFVTVILSILFSVIWWRRYYQPQPTTPQ